MDKFIGMDRMSFELGEYRGGGRSQSNCRDRRPHNTIEGASTRGLDTEMPLF